jgi:CheY-like chemotaxis protein
MVTAVSPTVLIVDDQPSVRKALRHYFEESHIAECEEAVDGQDAVDKVQQHVPDLILLDLSMPVMNGLDAAKAIKQINPGVPVIMITAHLIVATELWVHNSGIDAIFSKTNITPMIQCAKNILHRLKPA